MFGEGSETGRVEREVTGGGSIEDSSRRRELVRAGVGWQCCENGRLFMVEMLAHKRKLCQGGVFCSEAVLYDLKTVDYTLSSGPKVVPVAPQNTFGAQPWIP